MISFDYHNNLLKRIRIWIVILILKNLIVPKETRKILCIMTIVRRIWIISKDNNINF